MIIDDLKDIIDVLKIALEANGTIDRYVILDEDDKGRYLRYAFKDGFPPENRCLSWHSKPHPNLLMKMGRSPSTQKLDDLGKIYELSPFNCGRSDHFDPLFRCTVGHPAKNCSRSRDWTKDEPGSCACWGLMELTDLYITFNISSLKKFVEDSLINIISICHD